MNIWKFDIYLMGSYPLLSIYHLCGLKCNYECLHLRVTGHYFYKYVFIL